MSANMTTWINSQFPRPDFHRQVQRHYGLQDTNNPQIVCLSSRKFQRESLQFCVPLVFLSGRGSEREMPPGFQQVESRWLQSDACG